MLRPITRPNRERTQSIVFSWIDTRDVRPSESRAYAILNDSDVGILATVLDAIRSYDEPHAMV